MALSLALILFALPESRWREQQAAPRAERVRTPAPDDDAGRRTPNALLALVMSPAFIFVGLFAVMIVANRQGGRFSVMPLYGDAKGFGPAELGWWLSLTHLPQFFSTMASGFLSGPVRAQIAVHTVGGPDVRRNRRVRVGGQPVGNFCCLAY